MVIAQGLDFEIPAASELSCGSRVTKVAFSKAKARDNFALAHLFDDIGSMIFRHADTMTNNLSPVKTRERPYGQKVCPATIGGMNLSDRPYGDIAERVRWHRDLEGLTQNAYAKKIGVKRATLNNWESGDYRLSVDGALALRRTYGLSLDFMYEGIVDALPMTLRQAWLDRP